MSKPILGVDVSKLDLSISLLIDKKYYQTKVDNNQLGFNTLIKWLQKHEVTKVAACMEATGNYGKSFADFLYNLKFFNIKVCKSSAAKSRWDTILEDNVSALEEVVVVAQSTKERGKEIMKEVIDKRSYFDDLLSEFSCETYCFASLEKDKIDSLKKDSIIGREKLNLIEWRSKSYFKKQAKFKDEFYAYNDFADPTPEFVGGATISYGGTEQNLAPEGGGLENNPYLLGRITVNQVKDSFHAEIDIIHRESHKIFTHVDIGYHQPSGEEAVIVAVQRLRQYLEKLETQEVKIPDPDSSDILH